MNEAERRAASEKYYQKLRAELDERIRGDKQLRMIAEKIANKTADFNDTAKYSEIVSNYIGAVLQENVGEITSPVAKEFVCKELLRDQYSTINELFESVQVSIDEQNGIHIKTQKPKFPEERVDKVAHALEDPTVPLKTIKRRANAPVANVSKSFHDDCIKKNAQFRHDAGLKCYIIRIGTKCCEWCSEVAGKYEFGDQPDGIFRRHDNCDCTIIYDGQVLRGKQNADGSRSKTWEELPNANAADYTAPTLSEAEGRAIEQRNLAQIRGLKINNSSIDISTENDKIRNIKIDDARAAIQGTKINDNVIKTIIDVLSEDDSQYLFDEIAVVKEDYRIIMQTDPVKKGTFFDIRLNLNENFLGGKTIDELDSEIFNSKVTVCNSFREAIIHEKYHAKLINGLNQGQLDAIYEELSEINIDGISKTAFKDGNECIAEVGVLFERGETDDLPEEARKIFNKYIGGLL